MSTESNGVRVDFGEFSVYACLCMTSIYRNESGRIFLIGKGAENDVCAKGSLNYAQEKKL